MQCPECGSTHIRKNGQRRGKHNHICVDCSRQFIDRYEPRESCGPESSVRKVRTKGYPDEVKGECLRMYVNDMGFCGIERLKRVHHTTIITWVKQTGQHLLDAYDPVVTPQVGELDELETFIGEKKQHLGGIKGGKLPPFYGFLDSSRPL